MNLLKRFAFCFKNREPIKSQHHKLQYSYKSLYFLGVQWHLCYYVGIYQVLNPDKYLGFTPQAHIL